MESGSSSHPVSRNDPAGLFGDLLAGAAVVVETSPLRPAPSLQFAAKFKVTFHGSINVDRDRQT